MPEGLGDQEPGRGPLRETKVKYGRAVQRQAWEDLELETAMDMIADRIARLAAGTWEEHNADGEPQR